MTQIKVPFRLTSRELDFAARANVNWDFICQYLGSDFYSWAMRRPVLRFNSVSTIDVENNTGTAHETSILFPDGDLRTVVEDVSATTKYRRFDITATANFTSGTEDSGLRSGLSEASNTWYAIYAVKSQIDLGKFVLAGDTTIPIQANYATLESRYGAKSWLYLGMIRNGDNASATSDLLDFVQTGAIVSFRNTTASSDYGIELATTAGATTLTYTLANGTGAAEIPNHLTQAMWTGKIGNGATTRVEYWNSGQNRRNGMFGTNNQDGEYKWISSSSDGAKITNSGAASVTQKINLVGFIDGVLGLGALPQL